MIPYTVAFAAIGSRLVLDMWPSRLSIMAFVFAAAGYLVAMLTGLEVLPAGLAVDAVMLRGGAIMFGHLMLLSAMVLQARYVLMDYEGLLPPRKAKAAKPKKIVKKKAAAEVASDDSETDGDRWHRVDSAQGVPQPVLRRADASPVFTPDDEDSYEDDDVPNPTNRKLTKQEKKALKARLLRERADREKKLSKW
jgi:hypothetical protein